MIDRTEQCSVCFICHGDEISVTYLGLSAANECAPRLSSRSYKLSRQPKNLLSQNVPVSTRIEERPELSFAFVSKRSLVQIIIQVKMSLICMKINIRVKLDFIWKVLHQDSFWNRGEMQLGNGLFSVRLFHEECKEMLFPCFHVAWTMYLPSKQKQRISSFLFQPFFGSC